MVKNLLLAASVGALAVGAVAQAADHASYSRPARNDVPRQVFWGDTHLHTRLSSDAYSQGNSMISPEMTYRLARGEAITAQNGEKIKLQRPLDFIVISDHAEYLGIMAGVEDGDETVASSAFGKRLAALFKSADIAGFLRAGMGPFFGVLNPDHKFEQIEPKVRQSIWTDVGERADRFNVPGRFTAFIGYEFTPMPAMANLHRNVVFRDDASRTSQVLPFSAIDSFDPQDLWAYLDAYEQKTGGSALAIPHNSNLSAGRMFDETTYGGDPITAAYARTRMRWEPIAEVTQIKGDSETHPFLSPDDEFSAYETWRWWSGGTGVSGDMTEEKWRRTAPGSYARSSLKRGLEFEQKLDANPYKFGMIGSTDSHTSLPTAEEDNFWGKLGNQNPSRARWSMRWGIADDADAADGGSVPSAPINWMSVASGLAAVWAKENTREALFDAMRRKEVYATTGPRMAVRFFGGWDYAQNADKRGDYVDVGYAGGVPMGGDLTAAEAGKSPKFLLLAAKDPDGANLDRVQVIKGWVDARGKAHEKVYDAVWSGDRRKDAIGKLAPVGSTVDLKTASFTNTIGTPVLSTVWTDPDFNPSQRAFYYVRVLQIPTPRWPAYDAAFYNLTLPDNVPQVTQERAYTSPIWYTP